jgi:hypothetical protein
MDKALAVIAMVAAIAAVGTTVFCLMQFKPGV